MNKLQKKCVLATAGLHLLLLVILFLGPGFFHRQIPPDTLPTLKVIPANAVDAALNSGSTAATPAPVTPTPPAPVATPLPEPTPTPPTPEPAKPVVTPEPAPQPDPQPTKPVEPDVPDQPDDTPDPTPAPKPVKHHDISLTLVERSVPKKHVHDTTAEDQAAAEEKEERAAAHRRALAIARVTGSIEHNLTESTEVTVPGPGAQSYANYGQIVKSIYENAWNPPDSADSDDASPKVRVVISRDGSVISAHIITPSGDKDLDDSVQRTLDRVTFIRPFPEGATENQRSYIINFNLKAKRMLG